ncbi:unnamed protein product [Pleuronectes platessa]|uniref:Uncharacterized protein n=1 Tax=Pleuronectes platessa TaxID=8262 RepID=A0A9N7YW03_PLEPL|nr:unnamed protein product [Pleuronectes platessa]
MSRRKKKERFSPGGLGHITVKAGCCGGVTKSRDILNNRPYGPVYTRGNSFHYIRSSCLLGADVDLDPGNKSARLAEEVVKSSNLEQAPIEGSPGNGREKRKRRNYLMPQACFHLLQAAVF